MIRRDERGAIVILVALCLVALCLSAAFAVDVGTLAAAQRKGQHAVDDAAISAAGLLAQGTGTSEVASEAEGYVEDDFPGVTSAEWSTCPSSAIPSGFKAVSGEDCIGFNSSDTEVSVALPPQVVSYDLARLAGHTGTTVEPEATAMVSGGTAPCALCVLDTSGDALEDSGSGSITVEGGAIVDDSYKDPPAAEITGSGSITDTGSTIGVAATGTDADSDTGSGSFSPTPVTGSTPVTDPLAYLVAPSEAAAGTTILSAAYDCSGSTCTPSTVPSGTYGSVSLTGSGSATIPPGVYSSITDTGSGSLTLESGTYVITGELSITGSGSLLEESGEDGSGVLLYFTCSNSSSSEVEPCTSGEQGGSLSLTGSGSVDLSGLSGSGAGEYAGLTVFYDPDDASSMTLTGSGSSFSGTIYAESSALTLTGSGGTLSSLIVVGSTTISGSGSVTIDAVPSDNVTLPSSPYLCSTSAGNC